MKCIYCNEPITNENKTKEHIIPSALGGRLKSEDICCGKCNKKKGSNEDTKFIELFNPILASFDISRDRKGNEEVPYKYEANISTIVEGNPTSYIGKFVGKKLHVLLDSERNFVRNVKNDPIKYKLENLNFQLENKSFKTGMIQIAVNFAICKGLRIEDIDLAFDNNRKDISDRAILFPFVAVSGFDKQLEMIEMLKMTHTLMLFNIDNMLYAYIDLFNTFQYYVILSESYAGVDITETYHQKIEKRMSDEEIARSVKIFDYKDMDIIAKPLGIPITLRDDNGNPINEDWKEQTARIEEAAYEAIRTKPYEFNLYDDVLNCFSHVSPRNLTKGRFNIFKINDMESVFFYLNSREEKSKDGRIYDIDFINEDRYKKYCPVSLNSFEPYPEVIMKRIKTSGVENFVHKYTYNKMYRLSKYLFEYRKEEIENESFHEYK